MMLRASTNATGAAFDATVLTDAADHQLPHAELLTRFVDAVTGDDAAAADAARIALRTALGDEWLVDAAAVLANFEMMTRVADGTGARMRSEQIEAAATIRAATGVDAFPSARR
ncbi:MAG: hypothetical protein AB7W59_01205 [Acidimicrobiia bacterium]